MSEMHGVIVETVTRLFDEQIDHDLILRAQDGSWPEAAWQVLAEIGLPLALVAEAEGGIGLSPSDAFDLVRLAGAAAVPLPIGETMLTLWLATRLGLAAPEGPLTFAATGMDTGFSVQRKGGQLHLSGSAARVPAARHAVATLILTESGDGPLWLLVPRERFTITRGVNLAGEPRDDLAIDCMIASEGVPASDDFGQRELVALGAALRCAALAGAIERTLAITTNYTNERVQFGKPIGRQQAIQHALAQLAGEAATARAAASMAAAAIDETGVAILPIAAAKARIGEAAGKVAAIAHQVHGAIGFTREHRLHDLTTRLWAWREEFGNETVWSAELGRAALAAGAAGYWAFVTGLTATARSDAP